MRKLRGCLHAGLNLMRGRQRSGQVLDWIVPQRLRALSSTYGISDIRFARRLGTARIPRTPAHSDQEAPPLHVTKQGTSVSAWQQWQVLVSAGVQTKQNCEGIVVCLLNGTRTFQGDPLHLNGQVSDVIFQYSTARCLLVGFGSVQV